MPLVEGNNTVEVGFKTVIVIAIIGIGAGSFFSFVNGYPALGWFCLGIFFAAIFAWVLLAGNRDTYVIVLLLISIAIVLISYRAGVPSEWQQLTHPEEKSNQPQQGKLPTTDLIILSIPSPLDF